MRQESEDLSNQSEEQEEERPLYRLHKDEKKRIIVRDINIATSYSISYPSDWFKGEANVKPLLRMPLCVDLTLDLARQVVHHELANHTLKVDSIIVYVTKLLDSKPDRAAEIWTSFGRQLCGKDLICQFSNLFTPVPIGKLPQLTSQGCGPKDDKWMLIFVLAIYWLKSASNPSYQEIIQKSIDDRLKAAQAPAGYTSQTILSNYMHFPSDRSYINLLALVDMYLAKFPHNEHSEARVGTIITRFKDCAVLTDMAYLMKLVGLKMVGIARWLWTSELADDFMTIIKAGEEIDKVDSYMPYFMEMNLANKSPYSAIINPDLHMFIHTIGVCFLQARSVNSRMPAGANLASVKANAIIVGYVLSTKIGLAPQFDFHQGEVSEPMTALDESLLDRDSLQEPTTADPLQWHAYYWDMGGELPTHMIQAMAARWRTLGDVRDSTIGEHLSLEAKAMRDVETSNKWGKGKGHKN